MTLGASDRATRFRGEGRPKRRLSPSPPPPPPPKAPAVKTPSSKKSLPKQTEPSSSASKKGTGGKKKIRTPTPEESEEETLPLNLKEKRFLPTLKDRQPEDLSLKTYKSISESGVLHAALDKSRQRWLVDGLFEKFWVKYSRKNKDEPAPSSQSMTKINGDCSMIIEPHSFKITLFTVKAPPSSTSSQPATSNGVSTTSPGANIPPSPLAAPGSASLAQDVKPVIPKPAATAAQSAEPASEKAVAAGSDQSLNNTPGNKGPNPPPRPDNANNADPVIQMLAARAATDDELKALMKIVAQGQASQDQLSVFQRHIDELNGIIQAQKRQASGIGASTTHTSGQPYHTATFNPPHTPQAPAHLQPSSIKQEPFTKFFNPTHTPPVKPKATIPTKPILSAIVFEFAEASGTRYLLPKDSILEYLPGNTQVLMSFLITRKGDASVSGKHRASEEYYQPVTVRITADNAKVLEPLARVVAPPDEVRKRMSQQMETLYLAHDAFLALRLPRSSEEGQPVDDTPAVPKQEVIESRYDAPNSLLPISRPVR